jgi:D-alanyl-D-alanine carboxypeptidase/D-alanyl-D-alanine-endopeptidase (penicillin-binding protein 4)
METAMRGGPTCVKAGDISLEARQEGSMTLRGLPKEAALSARTRACVVAAIVVGLLLFWAPAPPAASLSAELAAIGGSSHLKGSSFGLTVYSASQDRLLYSVNGGLPLIPASNQKLLVTAAALVELGPDFTFTTGLYASGTIKDGVLYGDLILRGGGDPNLSGRFNDGDACQIVDSWVRAVQEAGITRMTGWLVIDDSLFDTQFVHPSWPSNQTQRWYSAAIGALSLNDSCIDLTVRPTSLGAPAEVAFKPYTPYITVRNACKTISGKSTDNIIISRNDREICLGGTIGARSQGYSASVAIQDPGLFAGAVFSDRLYLAGIQPAGVMRAQTRPDYSGLRVLMEYHSQDLATTVKVTNARSQNFYADTLLKYLGARRFGQGSFEDGVAAVREILGGRGVLSDAVIIDDGCGLSRRNRISTTDLVMVMDSMYRSDCGDVYVGSLAVPGDPEGTLKKRLNGERHNARICAKSGYINRVKALSGYVLRDDGEVLIFSFIVNNYASKSSWEVNNLQNKLMRSLSDCSMH